MFKKIILGFFIICVLSCETSPIRNEAKTGSVDYFENLDGCFLLYNMNTMKLDKVIGDERCRKQFPACSTFKVPLAVMAFESKILKDENVVLKWNGKREVREESNRNHNAQTWMKHSIVWFSQRLTPQIGKKRLQKYLNDFDYGNKDLAGDIKNAWLVSPSDNGPALKISGYEQLEFMKKLWMNKLPTSLRSMQLTRDITFLERLRQIKGFFYLYSEYPRPVPRDFWMSSTPQPLCYEPIAAPLILFKNSIHTSS